MKRYIKEKDTFDISFYQNYLKDLYSNINKDRDFNDIYGYLHRTTGFLGKAILADTQLEKDFILPFSWLSSLATYLDIELQEAFIKKYPGICSYCLGKPCVCYKTNKTPLKPIMAYEMNDELYFRYEKIIIKPTPYNLESAVNNILEIYSLNEVIWHFAGRWQHVAKIHEEIAEVHEAFGSYHEDELQLVAVADEVVDVLAWILAAWGILYPYKSLDEVFIDYYFDGCPICKLSQCKCKLFNSKLESLIDYNQLVSIKEMLEELTKILPDFQDDFSEILKSYTEVLQSHSGSIAKVTLSQTKDKLEEIKETIIISEATDTMRSLIDSILNISYKLLLVEGSQQFKPKQYDFFISYSFADSKQARELYDFLKTMNVEVFLSEKDLKPGAKLVNGIREALRNTKVLCIIASPDSIHSDWVKFEAGAAFGRDITIVPILHRCEVKALPEMLRGYNAIDFHEYKKILNIL